MNILQMLVAGVLISPGGLYSAEPIQWNQNGHFYEPVAVPGSISWEAAQDAAEARGGYLATISSEAENAFVFTLVSQTQYWQGASGPWLGGYQSPPSQEPGANWQWVTGEPWEFTRWQTGQPNHSGGKLEDRLHFGFGSMVSVWNDIQSVDPTAAYRPRAYVIEWDRDPFLPMLSVQLQPFQICWQTHLNRYYQLQSCSSLHNAVWTPVHTNWISGDGNVRCEADPIPNSGGMRFYRVVCTPSPPG